MTLRLAEENDVDALASLSQELGYPSSSQDLSKRLNLILKHPEHKVWVIHDPQRGLLGWAHVFMAHHLESDPFAELGGLVVRGDARKEGWGRRLVQEAEAWAAQHHMNSIRVRTRVERQGAHKFYEALGYEQIKTQSIFSKSIESEKRF